MWTTGVAAAQTALEVASRTTLRIAKLTLAERRTAPLLLLSRGDLSRTVGRIPYPNSGSMVLDLLTRSQFSRAEKRRPRLVDGEADEDQDEAGDGDNAGDLGLAA